MTSVLLIMMMINGKPSGEIQRLLALTPDCKSEISVVEFINRTQKAIGSNVEYKTECVKQ